MTNYDNKKDKTTVPAEEKESKRLHVAVPGRGKKDKTKNNGQENRTEKEGKIQKTPFEKPGNFLYPVPPVMVSCQSESYPVPNILTVAWAGTVCTDPPMVSISVKKERYSYEIIKESGEFVINLTSKKLTRAADFCGCRSGRDLNKFEACGLTPAPCDHVSCPMILESPVSLACKVTGIIPLGSHDMFLAEVVGVEVDRQYLDRKGAFHLESAGLIAYSHGKYYELGKMKGSFGFSVKKTPRRKK